MRPASASASLSRASATAALAGDLRAAPLDCTGALEMRPVASAAGASPVCVTVRGSAAAGDSPAPDSPICVEPDLAETWCRPAAGRGAAGIAPNPGAADAGAADAEAPDAEAPDAEAKERRREEGVERRSANARARGGSGEPYPPGGVCGAAEAPGIVATPSLEGLSSLPSALSSIRGEEKRTSASAPACARSSTL